MPNTIQTTVKRDSRISDELYQQLGSFYDTFLEDYTSAFQESGYLPRITIFGQAHDALLAVDKTSVIIIASKGSATGSASMMFYEDLSSRGEVNTNDVLRATSRDLGWSNQIDLRFNRTLLNAPEQKKQREFLKVIQNIINQIKQKSERVEKLGIGEAQTYLDNAEARFRDGTPEGFGDCISNCRNALLSLLKSLTGTDRVNDAVKILRKKGFLGAGVSPFFHE